MDPGCRAGRGRVSLWSDRCFRTSNGWRWHTHECTERRPAARALRSTCVLRTLRQRVCPQHPATHSSQGPSNKVHHWLPSTCVGRGPESVQTAEKAGEAAEQGAGTAEGSPAHKPWPRRASEGAAAPQAQGSGQTHLPGSSQSRPLQSPRDASWFFKQSSLLTQNTLYF